MAAADDTSCIIWKLCHDSDGGIDAKKTEANFYKAIMGSNNLKSETYLVLLRTAVAIVDVYQTHRTAHAALGAAGGLYVEPTFDEQQTWLLTDPPLMACMTDL